jgi:hypothetical protein
VKLLYVSCVTIGSGKIYGVLPDHRHCELEYPDCRTLPSYRRIRPKEDEKVSAARNNHAQRRCVARRTGFDLDDPFVPQLFRCFRFYKFRRYNRNSSINSCICGNCRTGSRRLARWLLALEGGYEDMLCEKEDYARYIAVVANSAVSWHHPLPEGNAAILRSLLVFRAESRITVIVTKTKNTQKRANSKMNYLRCYGFLRYLQQTHRRLANE